MSSVLKWSSKKGKSTEGAKTWLHSSESLTQGSVVYSVKLVGVTEVAQAKGTDVVREAITKVKFANHIRKSEAGVKGSKLRKVELKISVDDLRVEDAKTKEELHSYPLHRISYCADDKRDKKLFAFIAKDTGMAQHNCYVFECEKMAEELTLTVGQAFDLAYRRFLERKAGSDHSVKQMNEMKEKIKTAEEEKEALKQKIAQLEIAAQKGGSMNGNVQNKAQQNQPRQDEFDLIGDFAGFEPPPPLESERTFDPFASPTQQAESTTPPSAEFRNFPPTTQPLSQPPAASAVIPQALPPPPTKQSIKATNRRKLSGGAMTTVTSPTATSVPVSPPAAPPSNDLIQITGGLSNSNPFAVSGNTNHADPFSLNSFDPFASRPSELDRAIGNMQGEIQGLQDGFSGGSAFNANPFPGAMQ